MTKWADKVIDDGVFRWFSHLYRMENGGVAKRVYEGECAGSSSVDRARKRCIDNVKDCMKKRGWDVRQERKMVHDRNVWKGFVRRNT